MPATPYTRLIREVLRDQARFPRGQRSLAEFLHVRPQTVSYVINSGKHFNIEGSLRLALAANQSPTFVLRLAGPRQAKFADLLESLYGPGDLRPDVIEFVALYERARAEFRHLARELLRLSPTNGSRPATNSTKAGTKNKVRRFPTPSTET